MDHILDAQERVHKRKGRIASTVFAIAALILLVLPLLKYPDPPPGQEGVLVNLGLPDMGQGDENAGPSEPVVEEQQEEASEPEVSTPEPPQPEEPTRTETKPTPAPTDKVITTEDPDAIRLKKQQEKAAEEARKKAEAEAERERQEEAERLRQQEEARKKAEAEAAKKAEANKFKDKIGGLFGGGDGKGNTGTAGNQGDPDGDPDASKLEGISTGSGKVGGGLSGRGVAASPKVTDRSQDQGTVVVYVCVDASGKVISAEFTQKGTTATSARLKQLAVSNAKNWKFSAGAVDKQCGTITYNFQVK